MFYYFVLLTEPRLAVERRQTCAWPERGLTLVFSSPGIILNQSHPGQANNWGPEGWDPLSESITAQQVREESNSSGAELDKSSHSQHVLIGPITFSAPLSMPQTCWTPVHELLRKLCASLDRGSILRLLKFEWNNIFCNVHCSWASRLRSDQPACSYTSVLT